MKLYIVMTLAVIFGYYIFWPSVVWIIDISGLSVYKMTILYALYLLLNIPSVVSLIKNLDKITPKYLILDKENKDERIS